MEYTNLRDELLSKRQEIYTDDMKMSIGELISLYEDGEINLEPAFQRVFRWDEEMQTNFIESVLLGYPLPPIFVLQTEKGIWDVVDGVQRLSTIYNFAGVLKDAKTFPLEETKILTKLKGKYFSEKTCADKLSPSDELDQLILDHSTRLDFRRSTMSILIIKHGSEANSKYELFKRLNRGGAVLTGQEIRNALIIMHCEEIYDKMKALAEQKFYLDFINIGEDKINKEFPMDVLTRFIVFTLSDNIGNNKYSTETKIDDFLDSEMLEILTHKKSRIELTIQKFDNLIKFLTDILQSDDYGFRLYSPTKNKFYSSFNNFVFEQITFSFIPYNDFDHFTSEQRSIISEKIKSLQSVSNASTTNLKVMARIGLAKNNSATIFKDI